MRSVFVGLPDACFGYVMSSCLQDMLFDRLCIYLGNPVVYQFSYKTIPNDSQNVLKISTFSKVDNFFQNKMLDIFGNHQKKELQIIRTLKKQHSSRTQITLNRNFPNRRHPPGGLTTVSGIELRAFFKDL